MEQTQELIGGIQKGLLQWYDFKEESRALFIGEENTPLAQMLLEKKLGVISVQFKELSDERWQQNMINILTISYAYRLLKCRRIRQNI